MNSTHFFNKRPIYYWITVILLSTLTFATVFYSRWHRLYRQPALSITNTEALYLSQPTDFEALATKLDTLGWLPRSEEFKWAVRVLGWRNYQKGRYELATDINYNDLLQKLGKGIQDPQKVTVMPGTDLDRFKQRLADQFAFDSTAINRLFRDSTYLKKKSLTRQELFGRMLPNTYQFYWTESPSSVIDKILIHFREEVEQKFNDRIQQIRFDIGEIVTLASIIEWEANKEEEKDEISGLYWNRLERGMRLQADPTVLYALDERRRLYYEDYKIQHPYNTYIHDGLPPGPITNPTLSSIKAALYPAQHDYLYMVATPDGKHLYSETFEEHKRKSREWRKWIREQYRIKREREAKEKQDNSSTR